MIIKKNDVTTKLPEESNSEEDTEINEITVSSDSDSGDEKPKKVISKKKN